MITCSLERSHDCERGTQKSACATKNVRAPDMDGSANRIDYGTVQVPSSCQPLLDPDVSAAYM
jgi:hypothetical protein